MKAHMAAIRIGCLVVRAHTAKLLASFFVSDF